MENFWDLRYSEPGFVYGTEPNEFFRQELDRLRPGRILLPGEGEGRNAIYAARKGWEVTAFDQSRVARQKAIDRAKSENLDIRYQESDLNEYICSGLIKGFDLIALIYIHMPSSSRRSVHHNLVKCLRPGGRILMECFHADQLKYGTGGPSVRDLLYTTGDLQGDFRDLNIEKCEQYVVERREGSYHNGLSSIIQLTAIK